MKEIERVKIIINGKDTKNFKGNLTLNSDFPRNEAIVNKEVGMARPEDGGLVPVTDETAIDGSGTDTSVDIPGDTSVDPAVDTSVDQGVQQDPLE